MVWANGEQQLHNSSYHHRDKLWGHPFGGNSLGSERRRTPRYTFIASAELIEETSDVRARHDWRWLYLHTCGTARKQLQEAEQKEHPYTASSKRVQVEVDSITKTVTPESYQVLWKATTIDKANPRVDEVWWTSTITVGRVAPTTIKDATLNNLGLCVTWVDDDKRH